MTDEELTVIETALKGYYTCAACRTTYPEMVEYGAIRVHVDCPTPDAKGNALCFEMYTAPTRDQMLAVIRALREERR